MVHMSRKCKLLLSSSIVILQVKYYYPNLTEEQSDVRTFTYIAKGSWEIEHTKYVLPKSKILRPVHSTRDNVATKVDLFEATLSYVHSIWGLGRCGLYVLKTHPLAATAYIHAHVQSYAFSFVSPVIVVKSS